MSGTQREEQLHILFMGQHYAPEKLAGAVLAEQKVESLIQRGHQVTFATCFPNYPEGIVFEGYRGRLLTREVDQYGATVLRVWSYVSPKTDKWRRILNFGSFSTMALLAGLRAKKPDVIMSYSPPLPLGITAWLVSRWFRVPWIVRVEDLFPESAIKAGIFRNPRLIRFLERMELFIYRRATHISVISEPFRESIIAKGVPPKKISVIPVWADPDEIQPLPHQTNFRATHGLQGDFIILYTGNIGYTSALDEVLQAAEKLREVPHIKFVLIGEGIKKADLVAYKDAHQLDNVLFLPYQPRDQYADVLASADFSLVTLHAEAANTSLPSKTFNYFASERPVLAVAPEDSALTHLIQKNQVGLVIPPEQPAALANAIRTYQQQPEALKAMGQRGRQLLFAHFTRAEVLKEYELLFRNVANQR